MKTFTRVQKPLRLTQVSANGHSGQGNFTAVPSIEIYTLEYISSKIKNHQIKPCVNFIMIPPCHELRSN